MTPTWSSASSWRVFPFFQKLERGERTVLLPPFVLFQSYFVLTSYYEVPRALAAEKSRDLRAARRRTPTGRVSRARPGRLDAFRCDFASAPCQTTFQYHTATGTLDTLLAARQDTGIADTLLYAGTGRLIGDEVYIPGYGSQAIELAYSGLGALQCQSRWARRPETITFGALTTGAATCAA